jgi:hypothetical protein
MVMVRLFGINKPGLFLGGRNHYNHLEFHVGKITATPQVEVASVTHGSSEAEARERVQHRAAISPPGLSPPPALPLSKHGVGDPLSQPYGARPPPPVTLRGRLKAMPDLVTKHLWPAQAQAIRNLERSLADGRPPCLIQMATGSGKTFTACNFVYGLVKHAQAQRVLLTQPPTGSHWCVFVLVCS